MSFLVCGMAAQKPVSVDDASPITTSFPIFEGLMRVLGRASARVEPSRGGPSAPRTPRGYFRQEEARHQGRGRSPILCATITR